MNKALLPILFVCGRAKFDFVAFGDWGHASDSLSLLMESINQMCPSRDFVMLLGDNAYPAGYSSFTDPKFSVFEDVVATGSSVPHYLLLGNHDYLGNVEAQIEYSSKDSRWVLPQRYYKQTLEKDGTRMCMIFLDTVHFGSDQITWLHDQLKLPDCSTDTAWVIVSGHYPIWSAGAYSDSPELKANLLPLLETHNVPLYLCGHEHLHEVFYNGKLVQVVSGASADPRKAIQFISHELHVWGVSGTNVTGFVHLTANQDHLSVRIIPAKTREDLIAFAIPRSQQEGQSPFDHITWTNKGSEQPILSSLLVFFFMLISF
jgi:hypothetical protein